MISKEIFLVCAAIITTVSCSRSNRLGKNTYTPSECKTFEKCSIHKNCSQELTNRETGCVAHLCKNEAICVSTKEACQKTCGGSDDDKCSILESNPLQILCK